MYETTNGASTVLSLLGQEHAPAQARADLDFGGRIYPLVRRTEPPPIPEEFRKIQEEITASLALKGEKKIDLFEGYVRGIERLEQIYKEANTFLHIVGLLAGFEDAPTLVEFRKPPAYGIELELREPGQIAVLGGHLTEGAARFIAAFLDALDAMVEAKQAGLIAWLTDRSCRYTYYTLQVIETRTSERVVGRESETRESEAGTEYTTRTESERDVERVYRLSLHAHDLLEARAFPLPAKEVDPPASVNWLLSGPPVKKEDARLLRGLKWKVLSARRERRARRADRSTDELYAAPDTGVLPNWLRGHVRVVAGRQIREIVLEADVRTERWTEADTHVERRFEPRVAALSQPDPAVTLGHYVLAGWGAEAGQRAELIGQIRRLKEEVESCRRRLNDCPKRQGYMIPYHSKTYFCRPNDLCCECSDASRHITGVQSQITALQAELEWLGGPAPDTPASVAASSSNTGCMLLALALGGLLAAAGTVFAAW